MSLTAVSFTFQLDHFVLVLSIEAGIAPHRRQKSYVISRAGQYNVVQLDREKQYTQVGYLVTIQSIQSDSPFKKVRLLYTILILASF